MRSLGVAVILAAVWYLPLRCQPASPLQFEVASVKRAAANSHEPFGITGGPGTSDPRRIAYSRMALSALLQKAYGVEFYQIDGPKPLYTEQYNIVANVPEGTTREQLNLMLQDLLADRFRLTLHREMRTMKAYDLAVGPKGSKLKETGAAADPADFWPTGNFAPAKEPGIVMHVLHIQRGGSEPGVYLTAKAQTMTQVAGFFSLPEMHAPVFDKTGLTG